MKRITIMVDNRVGLLADISNVLAENNINIDELDVESMDEYGVAHLTTADCDRAMQVLQNAGFSAVTDDALIIKLKDEPGALAKITQRFKFSGVNIRSIHIIRRDQGYSTVALAADECEEARELLADILIV